MICLSHIFKFSCLSVECANWHIAGFRCLFQCYHIVGGSLTHPAHMGVFFMGSELQTMNGQNKLALWAERVSACRSSDLSVRDWCKENDISEPTYYRWQKKLYGIAKAQ